MSEITPSATVVHHLFYDTNCLEDDQELEKKIEQLDSNRRAADEQSGQYSRPSIYVEAFEHMVNTVRQSEPHLLSTKEIKILSAFSRLSYNARYCLIRLVLRKTNSWQTLASMESFKKEVGEKGLHHAIDALCEPVTGQNSNEEPQFGNSSIIEPEFIDLTGDSDEDRQDFDVFNPESLPPKSPDHDVKPSLDSMLLNSRSTSVYDPDFDFFLEDESSMSLHEALHKLNNDQLKDLVKQTKVKLGQTNKTCMIRSLNLYASTQTPLTFHPLHNVRPGACINSKSIPVTQERRLFQMALEKLGKSVRVNTDLRWLFTQLNVIYDRRTEYPKSLLVPSLLTSFKKRTYPRYNYSRDSTIWPNRDHFLEYFEALRLEVAIDDELEAPTIGGQAATSHNGQVMSPSMLKTRRSRAARLRSSTSIISYVTKSPVACKAESMEGEELPECQDGDEIEEVPIKIRTAMRVKQVFDEVVFPKFRALIAGKREQKHTERSPGLERFEPGFVYTRIFGKAIRALATLKLFREEAKALEALLEQRFWRCGKRAKWYERRAILQTRYLCFDEQAERKPDIVTLHKAMEGVQQALEDADTGLVFRPGLVRRLRRLEKQLKVPEEDKCVCLGELRKAKVVEFAAERLLTTSKSDKNNGNESAGDGIRTYFSLAKSPIKGGTSSSKGSGRVVSNPSDHWKWKGKSVWRGLNGEELNVESRTLQYYETLGYKGFHSESRILTTLFSLLFWDIIFSDVPGAFETPYQTAPLDLAEDSFFRARKELIEARLEEIKMDGQADALLRRHDELYREKKTWCVGVRWDICERQDLLEIVKCLGGESLSIICQLFCEDYSGRSSGVPDLIVWDIGKCVCKFVEVKGPGDRPQENQKLWFDSLLSAGANVEICKVLDNSQPAITSSSLKRKRTRHNSASNLKGKDRARSERSNINIAPSSDANLQSSETSHLPLPPDQNDEELPTFHSFEMPLLQQAGTVKKEDLPPPLKRHKSAPLAPLLIV